MQEPMPDLLTDAGPGTLAAAVRRRMKQVVWARLAPRDLTPQQFWVILVLLEHGPTSLHPLAQRVWMDDPTASRVVKAMTARGWLTTQPDPRHGRRLLIDLAPSALPMARELRALADDLKASLVAGLDAAAQAALHHGLRTMIANLDRMAAPAPAAPGGEAEASCSPEPVRAPEAPCTR